MEKHQIIHYVYKITYKHKLNVFTQKSGLFKDINNKKLISVTKSIHKNSYNLHLSNSPQLKKICPQAKPNNSKNQKQTTKIS